MTFIYDYSAELGNAGVLVDCDGDFGFAQHIDPYQL